jgi:hypothetical protein
VTIHVREFVDEHGRLQVEVTSDPPRPPRELLRIAEAALEKARLARRARTENQARTAAATKARTDTARADAVILKAIAQYRKSHPTATNHEIGARVSRRLGLSRSTILRRLKKTPSTT